MLLKTLRAAWSTLAGRGGGDAIASELPYELEARIGGLHARAPVARHLDILLGDARFGDESFPTLYRRCLDETRTQVTPFNVFQRFVGRLHLVRYFLASLGVDGARAEIGVYRGASALLLCRAARTREPQFDGADLYLVDSFAGAPAPDAEDMIPVRDTEGGMRRQAFFAPGSGRVDPEEVRRSLAEFPRASVVQGWVPEVLARLPERRWAFVHLDVNLYRPTAAALAYFWPRLAHGGVVVADDYGSVFTPGAKRAWHEFADAHGAAFIVLGERQAVLLKE